MNKLEVGMHVRTRKGCICQILRTAYSKYLSRNKELCYEVDRPINVNMELYDEDILKASYNIMDLIEDKDILKYIYEGKECVSQVFLCGDNKMIRVTSTLTVSIDLVDIKSIVTKEQFEEMNYEIK